MKWINVENRLPQDNSYVLIHLRDMPWHDIDDLLGKRFYKIVKFHKGKSKEELQEMEHKVYCANDEWSNNKKPYGWSNPPSHYFGQEVDFWMEIPLCPNQLSAMPFSLK